MDARCTLAGLNYKEVTGELFEEMKKMVLGLADVTFDVAPDHLVMTIPGPGEAGHSVLLHQWQRQT